MTIEKQMFGGGLRRLAVSLLVTLAVALGLVPGRGARVAYAESKTLASGTTYNIGDEVVLNGNEYVHTDESGGFLLVKQATVTVPTPAYDSDNGQWVFSGLFPNRFSSFVLPLELTGNANDNVAGFKCSGGNGTTDQP